MEKLTQAEKDEAERLLCIGEKLGDQGKFEQALKWFEKALAINPYYTTIYHQKGTYLIHLGRTKEALKQCDIILSLDPNDEVAVLNKGIALAGLKEHIKAIEWLDKAISLKPDYVEAYQSKVYSLLPLGRKDEARESLMKAAEIHFQEGVSLFDLEKYEEAVECFDLSISLSPEPEHAYSRKGLSLMKLKKYKEAVECFDKSLALSSDNFEALANKVDCLLMLEKYKEVIKVLQKALESNPKHSFCHCHLGITFALVGEHEKAIKHFTLAKLFLQDSKEFLGKNDVSWIESSFERITKLKSLVKKPQCNIMNRI